MTKTNIMILRYSAFVILLLLFPVSTTTAQETKAARLLEGLSRHYRALEPFRITYEITTIHLQDKSSTTATGELLLDGPRYVLKSDASEIYFDGTTLWNYLPDVNEVNVLLPDTSDHSIFADPQQLFSGYEKRYKFHYVGENEADGRRLWVVDLYPYDLNEPYSRVRLQIDERDTTLYTARYFGKDGTHYLMKILTAEHLPEGKEEMFRFDPSVHPGVEVIDMRDN